MIPEPPIVLRMAVGNVDGTVMSIRLIEVHDETLFHRPRVSYWVSVREIKRIGKTLGQSSKIKRAYRRLDEATQAYEASLLAVGLSGKEVDPREQAP